MSAKRMLADLLWEAANLRLWAATGTGDGWCKYTCDALHIDGVDANLKAIRFLEKLGFPPRAEDRFDLFSDFQECEQRQGVRYMWLLLAMHVAEDEGITL